MSPNPIAHAALLLVVPLTAVLFAMLRPARAFLVLVVAGTLLLPERVEFDPPGLPPLGKHLITSLCAFVAVALTCGRRLGAARFGFWPGMLAVIGIIGAVFTALTNAEPIQVGATTLPALQPYDAVSIVSRVVLPFLVPFFLARALVRTTDEGRDLLVVLAAGVLLYVPLILFELRMSPQLHRMIYGFHQHSFGQTIRQDGYRPMVFMAHGLALGMFVLCGVIASSTLSKARFSKLPWPPGLAGASLVLVLVLMKSFAVLVYAVAVLPIQKVAGVRTQRLLLLLLCVIVLSYPMARWLDVFPTERLVSAAASFSEDRAQSLEFRFDNEDALVRRVMEKPWFGWGGFNRGRVFDEYGTDISVTDGAWIIVLGEQGVAGFLCTFGILVHAVVAGARASSRVASERDRALLLGLSWIVAVQTVDLLPNGIFSSLNHFLAGCLSGLASGLGRPRRQA